MPPARTPDAGAAPSPAEARIARLYRMLQAGHTHDVEREARDALGRAPEDVAMLRVLATSLLLQKRMIDAIEPLRRATDIDPEHGESWIRLGLCLDARRDHEEAAAAYREGLARDPGQPTSWVNAATNAYLRGAWAEAEELARQGLGHAPDHPRLLLERAKALREQGRNTEAVEILEKLRAGEPDNPYVLEALALTLENLLRIPEAIDIRERLFRLRPTDRLLRNAMHELLLREGRLGHAADFLDRVEAAGIADDAAFACFRGEVFAARGRTDEAVAAWEQALARDPRSIRTARQYIQHRRLATDSELATHMRAVLAEDPPAMDARQRSKAAFILAKIHWDHGEPDEAMSRYREGNGLFREWARSGDREDDAGMFTSHAAAIRAAFPAAALDGITVPHSDDARPLFILGMARSGKSLVEGLLASDPAVAVGGECIDAVQVFRDVRVGRDDGITRPEAVLSHLRTASATAVQQETAMYLERLARFGPEARYISQTLPSSLLYAGIVHLLFPRARFIFCRRDLEDLGLSCYAMDFSDPGMAYTADLHLIGREIRACEALMDHWRAVLPAGTVLDLRYEDLVTDPDATMARVHEHLDLPPPTPAAAAEPGPAAPAFAVTPANPGRPRPDFIGIANPVRHHLQPLHEGYKAWQQD